MNRTNLNRAIRLAPLVLAMAFSIGCKKGPTLESAVRLEASSQFAESAQAYQAYLAAVPESPIGARACLGAARSYERLGDFEKAIEWYEKVGAQYPGGSEEVDALLDLGNLCIVNLKDEARGLSCYERALNLSMSRGRIREAIQALTDAQYLTATAYYSRREFKRADQAANAIRDTYPSVFLSTDTRAKVESLVDRLDRAEAIAKLDATMITVREELPYNKSLESDFFEIVTVAKETLPSPDGKYLVKSKALVGSVPCLFLGKVSAPGKAVRFTLIPRSDGASPPSWSPNSQELVYRRIAGSMRRLEKVDMAALKPQVLFNTSSPSLGWKPCYHPSGNKIAFVYEGNVWLINANGTNKSMMKTKLKLDYRALLQWSADGTMIRYRQKDAKKNEVDGILVLDILNLES